MGVALTLMPLAIEVAFVLLAVAMVADWIRQPDRRRGYLALAFGSLTLLVLIAPSLGAASPYAEVETDVALALFLLSGYALVMFRDSFLPLGKRVRRAVTAVIAVIFVLGVAAGLPSDPEQPHSAYQALVLATILTTWVLCVAEPTITLWLASRGRPAVEGARMRALSLGYGGLVTVIMVGTLGGSSIRNPNTQLALDLVTLAIVPLLYFSFYPPRWLRRMWSQPEEEELRQGLHDLLTYSRDKVTQAQRALGWATRLVGAAGAFIVDSDGSILATQGVTADEAGRIASRTEGLARARESGPPAQRNLLVVPLELQAGPGAMIILGGPFTPIFGDDEVLRLKQYAGSITASLDRVSLSERVAALEKAKTEFLNIASHELRGPMTVIKGYLTMLDAGSLGEMSSKAKSVLPLLISKSDEVNSMIEQMIEAARLEEGRLALNREPGDIVELTELAIQDVTPMLANHEIKLDKPRTQISADVDRERFKIVVKNLLSNAAKYSPEGTLINVSISQGDGSAIVTVSDQGIGIAEEDQGRLFTRFGRIEHPSTVHVAGTGLGLWLSREIARMHDGDITVESAPGRGSTFRFQVPATV